MRSLRWMCGRTSQDKIRNECFREHLGATSMEDKIRETRLRWFGNLQCRPAMPIRKSLAMQVDGPPRERGRPRRTWMEVVNIDLKK